MQPLLNIAVRAARRAGDIIVRAIPRLEAVNLESQLKAAEATLAAAEAERDRGVIRAPWAGVVSDVPVEIGKAAFSFAGADLLLLTSREDAFPTVVLEALSAGTPVIASEGSGGIPDLLRDSESVLSGYFSLSWAAPHLFGDPLEEFADDGRALLAGRSADGLFWDWPGDTEIVLARKPA